MHPSERLDVAVVGGGQAGLAVSYFLSRAGRSHVVFERGRVGEAWRSQRWDTFRLNTPNRVNELPGMTPTSADPDAFSSAVDLVSAFERYVADHALPVRTGTTVTSVDPGPDGGAFTVAIEPGPETIVARAVVVASGIQNVPRMPAISSSLPPGLLQMHSLDYRSPGALPEGAVLVVGSGQTGVQITEDLLDAGRRVLLSTSRVGRVRRRYRGRDVLAWWTETGFGDQRVEDLEDPAIARAAQPQVSGVGPRGHTVSLQWLARRGASLLGRLSGADGGELVFADDLAANVAHADAFSERFSRMVVDAYLERTGVEAPPPEDDPADEPDPGAIPADPPLRLDPEAEGITSVIWCTGVGGDFSWLHLPVLDDRGVPAHHHGVGPVPGVFFVGFPWLTRRSSGILLGVGEDAERVAAELGRHLDGLGGQPAPS